MLPQNGDMKKLNMLISLFVLTTISCSTFKRRPASQYGMSDEQIRIMAEIDALYLSQLTNSIALISDAMGMRNRALEFFHNNKCKVDPGFSDCKGKSVTQLTLKSQEIDAIYGAAQQYAEIRNKLFNNYINQSRLGNLELRIKQGSYFDYQVDTEDFKIDVTYGGQDLKTRAFMIETKMALASALLMYDNYRLAIEPYFNSKKIRYRLATDSKNKDLVSDIQRSFNNNENRIKAARATQLILFDWDYRKNNKVYVSQGEYFLDKIIQESFFFKDIVAGRDVEVGFFDKIVDRFKSVQTKSKFALRALSYVASKSFGNLVGLYQERPGKLKNMSLAERAKVKSKLRSMDIVLEKTPFRLTDDFIPGYYGHVAIWAGTEQELKELRYQGRSVWDHPAVVPQHDKIRKGHHIIEALRPDPKGRRKDVDINTLEHFLDIDDFLAIRDFGLSDELRAKMAIDAFEQIGKDYDFNFDVETDTRIVCSEIAYVVYKPYEWPVDRAAGRYTISPDHVAWQADGGCFSPMVMYVDGKEVTLGTDGASEVQFLQKELLKKIRGPEGIPHRPFQGCVRN